MLTIADEARQAHKHALRTRLETNKATDQGASTSESAVAPQERPQALPERVSARQESAEPFRESPLSDNVAGDGLVICPITDRNSLTSTNSEIPDDVGGLFTRCFPGRVEIDSALSWGDWSWDGSEGPVPQLHVAPGVVRLTAPDLNRAEKNANRLADSPVIDPGDQDDDQTRGEITGWSRKSRARMVYRLATLDYEPLMGRVEEPAMVTLTYPGEWEDLAPDGKTAKDHLTAFFKRYERAWGEAWSGIWKLEFQRRGAPHFHLLQAIPHGVAGGHRQRSNRGRKMVGEGKNFRQWLSMTWANIVGATGEQYSRHQDAGTSVDYAEGSKARNPRSLAQYFSKHGSYAEKEYQHRVPELWEQAGTSVGRFWGYRGLKPLVRGVTLTGEQSIRIARVLRGLGSRSTRWNGVTRKVETVKAVRRVKRSRRTIQPDGTLKQARDQETGELLFDEEGLPVDHLHYRWQTVPVRRMTGTSLGGGYLCVESGPKIAADLGRFIESCFNSEAERYIPVGLRGSISERFPVI